MTDDYREITAALRAVPGVAAAEVEPDPEGPGPGVLRLALVPGVDEVTVATEVGRLLRERFGLGVDAERVQLVEDTVTPDVDAEAEAAGASRHRAAIQRMHLVSSGLQINASVTLSLGADTCIGEAAGTATQSGVLRAVAAATVRAVEGLLGQSARFELEHLEVIATGVERTAVVSLTMLSASGSERLTGAAGVREDVRQAVIRATLDALNRRMELMLA